MKYTYYPGCSVKATANLYQESIDAIAPVIGIELEELDDWNCCGATAYMSVRELMSFAISARNLALAEKHHRDLVTPCSACYLVLNKTNHYFEEYPDMRKKLGQALEAGGLSYSGNIRVRHILDVIVNDIGMERISSLVKKRLDGLKVAPYYGCQIVRPEMGFDDPDDPQSMDVLIETLGAEAVKYSMKTKCCGASLMGTEEKMALKLCRELLMDAENNGAHCIITLCPLCQMNLDIYQSKVNSLFKTKFNIPVIYFSQLIGLALGIKSSELGMKRLGVKVSGEMKRIIEGA
ncbi:MAG: CoB--CoM heterodisulfide reductase iron-sulfur subunit B family protein [Candidatus Krumholzibacteriota bacterium]|nr:CoB--CoM heterodisulfide reductase iron-sulfur subunit B family protein [Candidatus Krumholzibacteriota bacterium]